MPSDNGTSGGGGHGEGSWKWNGVVGVTGASPLLSRVAVEQRGSTLSVRDARFGENEVYGGWVAVAAIFAALLLLGPAAAWLICPLVPIFGIGAFLQLTHARSMITWWTDSGRIVIRRASPFWKCTVTVPPEELSVAPPGSKSRATAFLFRKDHRALRLASGSNVAPYAAVAVAGMLAEAQGRNPSEDLPFEWGPFRDFDDAPLAHPRLMHVVRPHPDALVVKPTRLGRLLQALPLALMFVCWVSYIAVDAVIEAAGYLWYAVFVASVLLAAGSAFLVMAFLGGHTVELQRARNRLRARTPRQCGRALLDLSLSSVAAVSLAPRAGHGCDLDLVLIRPRQLRVHVLARPELAPLRELGREIAEFLDVPLLDKT